MNPVIIGVTWFLVWALMVILYGFIYELHRKIAIGILLFFIVLFIASGLTILTTDVDIEVEYGIVRFISGVIAGVFTPLWFEIGRTLGSIMKE